VKSDSALIRIPELEFEIPPNTQRGLLNTIEGFLVQSVDALKQNQEERRAIDPEATAKIDEFISRLESCSRGEIPFTFIVEDPAGNSFIENPSAPLPDPNLKVVYFTRTPEQNLSIGLTTDSSPEEEVLKSWNSKTNDDSKLDERDAQSRSYSREKLEEKANETSTEKSVGEEGKAIGTTSYSPYNLDFDRFDYKQQVISFPGNCSSCHAPCETRMIALNIPYFKEVIIMSSSCDACGYKSNDVKGGLCFSSMER